VVGGGLRVWWVATCGLQQHDVSTEACTTRADGSHEAHVAVEVDDLCSQRDEAARHLKSLDSVVISQRHCQRDDIAADAQQGHLLDLARVIARKGAIDQWCSGGDCERVPSLPSHRGALEAERGGTPEGSGGQVQPRALG